MNKKYATDLSHVITNKQIFDILEKAKLNIKDWSRPSKANKGISRGVIWNMFCKYFDINNHYHYIVKYRIIQ